MNRYEVINVKVGRVYFGGIEMKFLNAPFSFFFFCGRNLKC